MVYIISICIGISAYLEALAYYKQVKKTLICHSSKDVSSSSYFVKLTKYSIALIALTLSKNWVGLGIEISAFISCIVATIIIIKNKPDDWSWRNDR